MFPMASCERNYFIDKIDRLQATKKRLTSVIVQLNDALDAAANREDGLRHDVELLRERATPAETRLRWASEEL